MFQRSSASNAGYITAGPPVRTEVGERSVRAEFGEKRRDTGECRTLERTATVGATAVRLTPGVT